MKKIHYIYSAKFQVIWICSLLLIGCVTCNYAFCQSEQLGKVYGVGVFNILDYGAKGDGETLNTAAIQAAIDSCAANKGGTVLVPSGNFLTGALVLKSNVALHLAPTAVILASTNEKDYYLDGNRSQYFMSANDAENITIEGMGTINGQGWEFPRGSESLPTDTFYLSKMKTGYATEKRFRPHMVCFLKCTNITLRDATFTQAAQCATYWRDCSYVNIDGVIIYNRANQTTDGIHMKNCEHITISNAHVSGGDDAISIYNSARNIAITNCFISSRWAGIRLGPAAEGIFENIAVSNCVIYDTYGCAIKMQMAAGGVMENISFSDLIMNNVTGPISLNLTSFRGYHYNPKIKYSVGVIRNIYFRGIRATVVDKPYPTKIETPVFDGEKKSCITITSVNDHYIENISFSDVDITFPGGGTAEEAARRDIPELRGIYPEYFMFGVLPSYGMYVRNVKGLTLDNVRFCYQGKELRHALVCEGVDGLDITGFRAKGNVDAEALIRLEQSKNVFIHNSRPLNDITTFLKVEGSMSSEIHLYGNNLGWADKKVVIGKEVRSDAVMIK